MIDIEWEPAYMAYLVPTFAILAFVGVAVLFFGAGYFLGPPVKQ